jgi:hypothetical protein
MGRPKRAAEGGSVDHVLNRANARMTIFERPEEDGDLSRFVGWLTLTHTQRCHAHRHSTGSGHGDQGRFTSFPVQDNDHFFTVCRTWNGTRCGPTSSGVRKPGPGEHASSTRPSQETEERFLTPLPLHFLLLVILRGGFGTQAIDLSQQRVGPLRLVVGGMDQRAQRRPAQMRAVLHVRTTELMLGGAIGVWKLNWYTFSSSMACAPPLSARR